MCPRPKDRRIRTVTTISQSEGTPITDDLTVWDDDKESVLRKKEERVITKGV